MADEEDAGVATTPSGADEEVLRGGEGFGRWEKKRSELESLASQYEDAHRERAQSPYAGHDRLGQAVWARQKLAESPPPRYSAIYDDESKGEADYPNRQEQFDLTQERPQTQQTPIYPPNAPRQAAFPLGSANSPESLGAPRSAGIDMAHYYQQAGIPSQEEAEAGSQTGYPPIRTFAGNAETTPQNFEQLLANDQAYQALGPTAKEKYRQLALQAKNIRDSNLPVEKQYAPMHAIMAQMASLVHIHEEGEQKGAAKATATIAGQQAQQTPIYSEGQKQDMQKLRRAADLIRQDDKLSESEKQEGLATIQKHLNSYTPIGMQGPNKNQPGDIKIDQATGKAYTHTKDGEVQELENNPTYPSLAHEPSHQAHATIQKYAELYHTDIATATKIAMAAEMAVKGQTIPPGFLPPDLKPAGKGAEKTAHEDVGMNEKEYHATVLAREKATRDEYHKQNAPATKSAQGVEKPAGDGPFKGFNLDDVLHAERIKAGLGENFQDYQQKRQGTKQQPGQPENAGMPTVQDNPEQEKFIQNWSNTADRAAQAKDPMAPLVGQVPSLTKKMGDNIMNLTPAERGDYIQAMRAARKYDTSIPKFWDSPAYAQQIGALLPQSNVVPTGRPRGR